MPSVSARVGRDWASLLSEGWRIRAVRSVLLLQLCLHLKCASRYYRLAMATATPRKKPCLGLTCR